MSHTPRPTPNVLDEATRILRDTTPPSGPSNELTAATSAAVTNRLAGTTPANEIARHQRRRKLMRYIGYGTATAIVATLATVAGLLWFAGPSAAAKVQKAMDEVAKAKSFRAVRKAGTKIEQITIVQGDSFRLEIPDKRAVVVDMKSRKAIDLDLVAKTAERAELRDGEVRELARQLAKARDMLGTYRRDKAKVTELPAEKIGDRETNVYAIDQSFKDIKGNPISVKYTLWLDAKTGFPVQHASHHSKMTTEFDSWNEEFDSKLFELKIPTGYREITK